MEWNFQFDVLYTMHNDCINVTIIDEFLVFTIIRRKAMRRSHSMRGSKFIKPFENLRKLFKL